MLVVTPLAWSQVQLGETSLTSSGLLGFGYSKTTQTNTPDLSQLFVTLSGNLNGTYHDPRFLSYTIAPYLNQSNLNSNYNSSAFASGVSATANFLSASSTPMQLSYAYAHDSQGNFNVPGQIGAYKTIGNSQDIGFSAAWLPEDLPSIQGTVSHGSSDYEVVGQPGTGTSSSTVVGIGSSYELWETQINGSYTKSWVSNNAPLFGSQDQFLETNADQSSWQIGASRALFGNSSLSANYTHSSVNDNYANSVLNTSFNTFNALYNVTFNPKLNMSAHLGYSSNLSAQYFNSIISGGQGQGQSQSVAPPAQAATTPASTTNQNPYLNFTSSYLNYGANASYQITKGWWMNGTVNRIVQGVQYSNADIASTDAGVGTVYSRDLLGGAFGASYNLNYFWSPVLTTVNEQTKQATQTVLGQNMSVSYAHDIFGWTGSGSASYGRGLTTVLVGYVQDGYSLNGSLSRQWSEWNLIGSASYISNHVENLTIADNAASSFNLSVGKKRWGVSANYSRSNGSGFQVGGGIVPVIGVPGEPGQVPELLMLFKGEAWGMGGTWQPTKRLILYGSYSHVHYNAASLATGLTANVSDQGYLRAQYYWRQLIFNAGFSYLQQGLGQPFLLGPGSPTTMKTVFFGVSRRFDFF